MGLAHSPRIVTDGLVLCLDAANVKSYPGSGTFLADITNSNNNVTLQGSPTFSALKGGGIVFDGSSVCAFPAVSHSYLNSCAMEVVFNSNSHGSGYKTIFGYRHNSGYSLPTIGSIYLSGNTLSATIIGVTDVYRTVTSSLSISTNTDYHVVFNKDTINGSLQLYVNGIFRGSQTFTAANYAQWTTLGSYIGANFLDIGKSTNNSAGQNWGTDYFSGTMYTLKLYNRTLSAIEIQQNFNALRGRFGI